MHFTAVFAITSAKMKTIVFGIAGSIASYRSPDVIKLIKAKGHRVRPLLTRGGEQFVTRTTLETVASEPVLSNDVFDPTHLGTDHIQVARDASLFVVYGATADFIAKYRAGICDDFLLLQLIATQTPVLLVPAMNPTMFMHPSVQENIKVLSERGVHFEGPIAGVVQCGEEGIGHIAEHEAVVRKIEALLSTSHSASASVSRPATATQTAAANLRTLSERKSLNLSGKRLLISMGPMRTSLDPVRYIQNRSSGKMGIELALEAKRLGAEITLLLGPVSKEILALATEHQFAVLHYQTPAEYRAHLETAFPKCDVFFSLAAVLDFETLGHASKIERQSLDGKKPLAVGYKPVPDFVAMMSKKKKKQQKVIAFAAETGSDSEIVKRAQAKMLKKNADALIANPVREGLGPEADRNEIWILRPGKKPIHFKPDLKARLARPILEYTLT